MIESSKIRNVAIIAHVDHGKTTLVDQLLRQGGAFRDNQEVAERVMDNNDLERERGITILSKNTSISYKGHFINIVDTPGHADFGGQVERVLSTVDGVLLVVDAFDGPMAQTRFVLQKALELNLQPIVVVNKIDRPGCDPHGSLDKVFDLFVELHANDQQLDFPHIFAAARNGVCRKEMEHEDSDFTPLFDMIVEKIPAPKGDADEPLSMLVSSLDYSEFLGRLAIGRIKQGTLKVNQTIGLSQPDGTVKRTRCTKIYAYLGLKLTELSEAGPGQIVQVAGVPDFELGDTITDPENPLIQPRIEVDPPTISMIFQVNDSPFAGKEGRYVTSTQIGERLRREALGDVALRVEQQADPSKFLVSGRGVLHLSILIEKMRREQYEFAVGRPQVILKEVDGKVCEPIEIFTVDVPTEHQGPVIQELGSRRGDMVHMETHGNATNVVYHIPSRGLIGLRSKLLSLTRGYAVMQTLFKGYEPLKGEIAERALGAIISKEDGETTGYSLFNLQDRGAMFCGPGVPVYTGMIIGEHCREDDIVVNIVKGKKLTNMRASGSDDNIVLTPPRPMTLEDAITWINTDEIVEMTPESIRIRKLYLDENERKRMSRRPTVEE
ncbi:MAG TPA: translational GTPase TypA [Fibrobacteria bacterium]|nr:translational GTPase TypA [Fibrobacteria bacterium]